MPNETTSNICILELKAVSHLKAAGVESLRFEKDSQVIASMDWPLKVGFAMHHWQGDGWSLTATSTARKDGACGDAIARQALFPRFVAPAKQLIKMHHAGGISLAKTHIALESKPVVGGWHGDGQGDGEAQWMGSACCWKAWRTNDYEAIAEHQPKQPIHREG